MLAYAFWDATNDKQKNMLTKQQNIRNHSLASNFSAGRGGNPNLQVAKVLDSKLSISSPRSKRLKLNRSWWEVTQATSEGDFKQTHVKRSYSIPRYQEKPVARTYSPGPIIHQFEHSQRSKTLEKREKVVALLNNLPAQNAWYSLSSTWTKFRHSTIIMLAILKLSAGESIDKQRTNFFFLFQG